MTRAFYIALGIWALLTGLFAVTNLRVEWGPQLLGFAALIAGFIAIACGLWGWATGRPLT